MSVSNGNKKNLGHVTVPSGMVMLLDFGLMDLWTHDDPPFLIPGILDDDALEAANNGVDFKIEGPDAVKAGALFERQPHPLYVYDIPRHGVNDVYDDFRAAVDRAGLNADLRELPERVSPRKRADLSVKHFAGAGVLFLHGIHIIVIDGLPKDRPLVIEGEKMGEGQFAECWREISLVVNPELETSQTRKIGYVAVDMARLMFCDIESAAKWVHQESGDGLADFVFWGRDALRLAKKFNAPHVENNIYGWVDKPIGEIMEISINVQKHLTHHHMVAATDFRPHSDHWRMLKTLAANDTESGVMELDGSECCGFMTSWGDGFFPVLMDLDENGAMVRIRIVFGTEETLRGMHLVNPIV